MAIWNTSSKSIPSKPGHSKRATSSKSVSVHSFEVCGGSASLSAIIRFHGNCKANRHHLPPLRLLDRKHPAARIQSQRKISVNRSSFHRSRARAIEAMMQPTGLPLRKMVLPRLHPAGQPSQPYRSTRTALRTGPTPAPDIKISHHHQVSRPPTRPTRAATGMETAFQSGRLPRQG